MSGYNQVKPGQVIKSVDYNDHLLHDGAIDGKDFYKLLSAEQLLYKESTSEYFIREGIKGKPTTYSSFAAALSRVRQR